MKTVTVLMVILIAFAINTNAQITTVWDKDSSFSNFSLEAIGYPLELQIQYFVKYNVEHVSADLLDPNSLDSKYNIDLNALNYSSVDYILPDLNNNGHVEVVVSNPTSSVAIVDAQNRQVIQEWKDNKATYPRNRYEYQFEIIKGSNNLLLYIITYKVNDQYSLGSITSQTLYDLGVSVNPTAVNDDKQVHNFLLRQNYPNPFNPSTTIKYSLPKSANVEVQIYNSIGQRIKTLVNQFQSNGEYSLQWDGNNDFGQKAASGTYIYQINVDGRMQTKKMMLLK